MLIFFKKSLIFQNISINTLYVFIVLLQVWADVYAKALEGKDLKEILSGFHNAGPAVGATSTGAATGAAGEATSEEAAAEEEAEESDEDMGFGLFD